MTWASVFSSIVLAIKNFSRSEAGVLRAVSTRMAARAQSRALEVRQCFAFSSTKLCSSGDAMYGRTTERATRRRVFNARVNLETETIIHDQCLTDQEARLVREQEYDDPDDVGGRQACFLASSVSGSFRIQRRVSISRRTCVSVQQFRKDSASVQSSSVSISTLSSDPGIRKASEPGLTIWRPALIVALEAM